MSMQAHKVRGHVSDDGSLTLENLPFAAGEEVEVTVTAEGRQSHDLARYPLRGTPIRYSDPTSPVAEDDWEALR
jgi:hypothetical protein